MLAAVDTLAWDPEDALLAALGPLERETAARRRSRELYKAIMLAPTLEICEALLRGEPVPVNRLDPAWRKAYGL